MIADHTFLRCYQKSIFFAFHPLSGQTYLITLIFTWQFATKISCQYTGAVGLSDIPPVHQDLNKLCHIVDSFLKIALGKLCMC